MGLTLEIVHPAENAPSWSAIRERMQSGGRPLSLRMINGELAFPDEEPPADWHELRVATAAGMLTLRRAHASLQVIVWGNTEGDLLRDWHALAWVCAMTTGGHLCQAGVDHPPEVFRTQVPFPPGFPDR